MRNIALLGAGFSYNWGGWLASEVFEYLLGTPEVLASPGIRELLWRYQATGGFEDALAELQREIHARPDPQSDEGNSYWSTNNKITLRNQLLALQRAVGRMFDDMNAAFVGSETTAGQHFWRPDQSGSIGAFLPRFDVIFTLNQDLLLEHLYVPELARREGEGWKVPILSGMRQASRIREKRGNSEFWSEYFWEPVPKEEFSADDNTRQPIYKLHGSSNWRTMGGDSMLIIGGEKTRAIKQFPVLDWYADQFGKWLSEGTRLMVIGYGLRDRHINDAIRRAALDSGLKLFVVDPKGSGLGADADRWTLVDQRSDLDGLFKAALIGASRRPITNTLRENGAEAAKLRRFLEPAAHTPDAAS